MAKRKPKLEGNTVLTGGTMKLFCPKCRTQLDWVGDATKTPTGVLIQEARCPEACYSCLVRYVALDRRMHVIAAAYVRNETKWEAVETRPLYDEPARSD